MSNINNDIQLDFPIPKILAGLIEEAEEADNNNSEEYGCIAEAIDNLGKEYYVTRRISRKQWDMLCAKYPPA